MCASLHTYIITRYIITRYDETNNAHNIPRFGRPTVLTKRKCPDILKQVKMNTSSSCWQLAENVT